MPVTVSWILLKENGSENGSEFNQKWK